ncbi:ABC transporter ATP-binding protein [Pseudosulfitobacter pseudonitzschiae]|uniref:ABC transporter ATP-binding protein n=2 Tax=Pseudosulfitobacter pseudonitzschiae TaxID=1402135 RepID=A0A073J8W3_9RHOB|nr:ABC transporter ATP-binding protein [Pseudosulfitobacter pseudonitzschiae]
MTTPPEKKPATATPLAAPATAPVNYASSHLMTWLWQNYLKRHVPTLIVAVMFMIIEGSMLGALSWMMQPMFDTVFVQGNGDMLIWVGVLLVGIFVVRAVSSVVQKVLLTRIAQKTAAALRIDLLDHMMKLDGAFHQSHPPGFLIQRVQQDVNAVGDVWRAIITGAGRDFIGLIVLIGVAISVDPIWALLACVGTPLLVLPAAMAQRYVRRHARNARDLGANLSTRLDEVFHGIVQIKLNALEDYQSTQYRGLTDRFVRTEVRTAFGGAAIPAMIDIMSGAGFMAVILYGGAEIIAGDKTIGQFMTFFTAMGFAFDPLRRLGAMSGLWQVAAAAIERIKELLDAPVNLKSAKAPKPVPTGTPEIALENVTLAYGNTTVLHDLSLVAAPGKTTALVGASGAGKSTIFNLLTRLVDPQKGVVKIGGVPAAEMKLHQLRSLFSVVTQEALLFDETLRENILLGRTDVSDARLKEVLDAAHVSDFLSKLPDGLDTHVGPRGSALSGGQRQRVVIARALLRDTPILLLDEATSALDAQSEHVVQEALDRLAAGRTTIVIAHRLSTIRGADKIIVMDRGKVIDQGTHDELLARGGIYADLYRLQFQDGKTVVDVAGSRRPAPRVDGPSDPRPGILARMRERLFG